MTEKEKLEEAKRLYKTANADQRYVLESLFSELKESEDEKVKRILHSISSKMSFHLRDIFTDEEFQCFDTWSIAWLEKQKPAVWSEVDKNFMHDTLSNLTELKDRYGEGYGNVGKCIGWLKSLKQRMEEQQ